jgi:hypothetical protein
MPLSLENHMDDNDNLSRDDFAMFGSMLGRLSKQGAFIGLSAVTVGCASIPDAKLEYRDGVVVVCVDTSEKKEDKCYKVEEEPLPPKGAETPE